MLLLAASFSASAEDKITVTINKQTYAAYRTADLEAAKKEAIASRKPIAWIASATGLLDGRGSPTMPGSRGATLEEFEMLHDKAVLVFMDAYKENHKVLKLVDDALHTPNPHYIPPTVVFLDSEAKQVLATVPYEQEYEKRTRALQNALDQIKGK